METILSPSLEKECAANKCHTHCCFQSPNQTIVHGLLYGSRKYCQKTREYYKDYFFLILFYLNKLKIQRRVQSYFMVLYTAGVELATAQAVGGNSHLPASHNLVILCSTQLSMKAKTSQKYQNRWNQRHFHS